MSTELVPSQEKGKSVDLRETVIADNEMEAKKLFQQAVYRLSRPGLWHATAGTLSASFTIDGKQKEEELQQGDMIRISIPGPGLSEGDGDDWVTVSTVDRNFEPQFDESYGILLHVSPNPHSNHHAIAHFFAEGASSSFMVTRKDRTLTSLYKGRNETPNTENLNVTDKVRNLVVAGGALAGISELQWTTLLKGLISPTR